MERIRVARFKTCSFPPDCLALHPASLASFCVFLVRGREKQALPGSCQAVEELLDYSILFSLSRQWNWFLRVWTSVSLPNLLYKLHSYLTWVENCIQATCNACSTKILLNSKSLFCDSCRVFLDYPKFNHIKDTL